MPPNMLQLPKEADFLICGWQIYIQNHRAVKGYNLFPRIMGIIRSVNSDRQTLTEFEKHGISYEAAIECCAEELEENPGVLVWFISWMYVIRNSKEPTVGFSKSKRGRFIADQLVEKIRNCDGWVELYDELHHSSRFQKEMKKRIIKELKEQNRIKKEMIK